MSSPATRAGAAGKAAPAPMKTTRTHVLRPLLGLLVAAGLALPAATATAAGTGQPTARGCAKPLFSAPQRAATAKAASSAKFASAAVANGKSQATLSRLARDHTMWLDRCGKSFYVDHEVPTSAALASGAFTGVDLPAGTDPLALSSRPGAPRTIYLDFLGGTVTGTGWNSTALPQIDVEPFSVDAPADTSFDATEQTQIYRAWLVVSEHYAPFDVNVTTKDPGAAALDRTDASDQSYGTTVMVTNGGPLYNQCKCGGQAYVGSFNDTGAQHAYYQPAWVFGDGTNHDGWSIGQAAAHEAGHNFGLSHDGHTNTDGSVDGYYLGTDAWAPIMGASYYSVLAQWSNGQYAGANNQEDDLSIIATGAPLLPDDHGDTAATADPLDTSAPVDGLISTRTDKDAFSFTAGGATTVSVTPATGVTDLDADLRIFDAGGALVADVNPAIDGTESQHPVPAGLEATWTATLPTTPATYTAVVDGSDNGDRLPAEPYDDYGSLGRYQITLTTDAPQPPPPLTLHAVGSVSAPAGVPVDAWPGSATGGTAPYTWSASGLPAGLAVDPSTGHLTGAATTPGTTSFVLVVTDAQGRARTAAVTFVSARPLSIATGSLPNGQAGHPYRAGLTLDGLTPGTAWSMSLTGALPPGLSLTPTADHTSATLAGTPTQAGTYGFRVVVSAADGQRASRDYTVTISPPMTFATSATLPSARYRHAYKAAIVLRNASPGLAWGVVTSSLPRGLKVTVASGGASASVHGTPTRRGLYRFMVRVSEHDGHTLSRTFSIRVR